MQTSRNQGGQSAHNKKLNFSFILVNACGCKMSHNAKVIHKKMMQTICLNNNNGNNNNINDKKKRIGRVCGPTCGKNDQKESQTNKRKRQKHTVAQVGLPAANVPQVTRESPSDKA